MTIKTENKTQEGEKVVDDISENYHPDGTIKAEALSELNPVSQDKLAALKAKLAAKKEEETVVPPRIVTKRTRSISFGIVGSGQAGSRLAETFYKCGYDAIVFNTAPQDLEHIDVPEANKFLLEYGLGGAAKELEIGRAAAETHKNAINQMVYEKLGDCQVLMLCLSLGGGSGAGSCQTMVDVLSATGKPVVVMTVLPMSTDDAQTKRNALETLAKLAKEAQAKRIHNLIVVDNAKISTIYSNVSPMEFFDVSNKAIVDPIDAFNTLSAMASSVKPLDSMEWAKIVTDGAGLSVYGEMSVANYTEETAIAEAVVENLNNGLLASGFDLKQSKYVGVITVARKDVWAKIPRVAVDYAMNMIDEVCGTPDAKFHGIYASEDVEDDVVKVYSIFAGLGLPDSRVQQLKKDAQDAAAKVKDKAVERNLSLKLDTGTDETTSQADKIRQQIAAKKSAFGGLLNSTVQDRRKK